MPLAPLAFPAGAGRSRRVLLATQDPPSGGHSELILGFSITTFVIINIVGYKTYVLYYHQHRGISQNVTSFLLCFHQHRGTILYFLFPLFPDASQRRVR
jgi:hypothetical protein